MRQRTGSALSAATVGVLSLVLLTGCSPADDGLMGIARDADGNLMVLARTCERPIDGAVLRGPKVPKGEKSESSTITRWEIDRDVESLSIEWPLLGPGIEGVEASEPLEELPSPYYLELTGYRSSSFNAVGPAAFDAETLEALEPGQVLIHDLVDGIAKSKVVDLQEFDLMASCET